MSVESPEEQVERILRADAFPINLDASSIEILHTPKEFFKTLLHGLDTVRRDVTMAVLYIGIEGEPEVEFVRALERAAQGVSRPELRISILLDAARATRPCKDSKGRLSSTAEVLASLLLAPGDDAGSRIAVSLFQTPHSRASLHRVLPPRVREVMGVQHIKAFVFDDDVILTGANISTTYLTNRQDRYMVIRNAPQLAARVRGILGVVGAHSFQLRPRAPGSQQGALMPGLDSSLAGGPAHQRGDVRGHPPSRKNSQAYSLAMPAVGINPSRRPVEFSRSLRLGLLRVVAPEPAWARLVDGRALEEMEEAATAMQPLSLRLSRLHRGRRKSVDSVGPGTTPQRLPSSAPGSPDAAAASAGTETGARGFAGTWVVPVVQAGFAGLRQEEACTLRVLSSVDGQARRGVRLSTPYLNPPRPLLHALGRLGRCRLDLLTSSPETNGFWGSRGLSGRIPLAYAALEAGAWRRLARQRRARAAAVGLSPPEMRLLEFARPGWEYHAKGIWLDGPAKRPTSSAPQESVDGTQATATPSVTSSETPLSPPAPHRPATLPFFTALGSSNFGIRSQRRDLELQFLLWTDDPRLRRALEEEWARLTSHANSITTAGLRVPERRAGLLLRGAVKLIKSFL